MLGELTIRNTSSSALEWNWGPEAGILDTATTASYGTSSERSPRLPTQFDAGSTVEGWIYFRADPSELSPTVTVILQDGIRIDHVAVSGGDGQNGTSDTADVIAAGGGFEASVVNVRRDGKFIVGEFLVRNTTTEMLSWFWLGEASLLDASTGERMFQQEKIWPQRAVDVAPDETIHVWSYFGSDEAGTTEVVTVQLLDGLRIVDISIDPERKYPSTLDPASFTSEGGGFEVSVLTLRPEGIFVLGDYTIRNTTSEPLQWFWSGEISLLDTAGGVRLFQSPQFSPDRAVVIEPGQVLEAWAQYNVDDAALEERFTIIMPYGIRIDGVSIG